MLLVLACSSDRSAKKPLLLEPEGAFKEANEKIRKKDYEAAREILEDIKARDASKQYAPLAQIRIGDTYFEEGLYEEAVVEYEAFLNRHPHHKYAPYAQYRLAMSFFKRIKGVDTGYSIAKRALQEFEKLQRRYPRNPYMDVTEERIKRCRGILAEYELYVGRFYFKKGSYRAAMQRFNGMLQNYPDSKKVSEALYYLGLSYEKMGNREKAIEVLTTLIERFPATRLSIKAKDLIASFNKEQ